MTGRCYTTFAKTILHVCSREGEKNILQKWLLRKQIMNEYGIVSVVRDQTVLVQQTWLSY